MKKSIAIVVAALALIGGCCSKKGGCGDNPQPPIVSPTNITNTVQGDSEPTLPHYVPWWAKEK